MLLPPDHALVAIGSNLGDRRAMIDAALERLGGLGEIVARSRIYETAPVGPPQPVYLNAAVRLRTELESLDLLHALLRIERALGRERRERWGPRVIDLDLVAHGSRVLAGTELVLPHPEAHRRAFVLAPLADVAPDAELPGFGRVSELLARLPQDAKDGLRALAT